MGGETTERGCVLVVDDDLDVLDVLATVLARKGYDVHAEQQAVAAVERVKALQPAVVVLDLVWRGQPDGWRVLKQMRQDPAICRIPVILATAADEHVRSRQRWLQANGVHVLLKPFALHALLDAVAARVTDRRLVQA